MRLLVIGGTRFVGRHLVEVGLARGHDLTLFNRGRTDPGLFPDVELIKGDRGVDIEELEGRSWDAVIDTCGYVPRVVDLSARALVGSDRYLFVSSVSVYSDTARVNDEDAPVGELADPSTEEITGETYGPLKAACERVVQLVFGPRATVVRPGLIAGPHDPTDRFTYWPVRIARAGQVVAPLPKHAPVQFIDARDLATWMMHLVEGDTGGVFNAVGPERPVSFGEIVDACIQASASTAEICWVEPEVLLEMSVVPWTGLPLWIPGETHSGMSKVANTKAVEAGLEFRSLFQTVRDTLVWAQTRPAEYESLAGLTPERELQILSTSPNGVRTKET